MTTRTFDQAYYKGMFMDILADVATYDTVEENRESIGLILAGFIEAIDDWMVYHDTACRSYKELRDELLGDVYGTPEAIAAEEMSLPIIPPFPSLVNARRAD